MSGQFTLTIALGNDAMRYPDDVAAALRGVVERLEGAVGYPSGSIRDGNGNTVGAFEMTPEASS